MSEKNQTGPYHGLHLRCPRDDPEAAAGRGQRFHHHHAGRPQVLRGDHGDTDLTARAPCPGCPWTMRGQPDITDELRGLAVGGSWFCCHERMGECDGARLYGASHRGSTLPKLLVSRTGAPE